MSTAERQDELATDNITLAARDLDLDGVLAALDAGGYPGCVGLAYRPSDPTADSCDWLPRARRASPTCARRQRSGGTR